MIETILLAEDNVNDVLLLRRAFKNAGLTQRLLVVSSGEQVLQYITGEGQYADRARFPFPQLLLLDLKMPRMTGLEVLAWLQTRPEAKHLPAIALTDSSRDPDVKKAYELGAYTFWNKPAEFKELAFALKQVDSFWNQDARPPVRPPHFSH